MPIERKIFSLEEANALLPCLEKLLSDLEEKRQTFQELHDELFFEELLEEASPPEQKIQELETILTSLEEEIQKIHALGCLLRHPHRGLVDFLARKEDEWIFYCWRRGEKEVGYYHSLRGGYWERHPIN